MTEEEFTEMEELIRAERERDTDALIEFLRDRLAPRS